MRQHRPGLAPHLPRRCFNLYFTKSLRWFSLQALTLCLLAEEDASLLELLDGFGQGLIPRLLSSRAVGLDRGSHTVTPAVSMDKISK